MTDIVFIMLHYEQGIIAHDIGRLKTELERYIESDGVYFVI